MWPEDKCIQTDRPRFITRKIDPVKSKLILKLISSLVFPCVLAVFTFVITIQQQKVARLQREEDRTIARLQREEDRNSSALQRAEDQEGYKLQREMDRASAEQQRELERSLTTERHKNELFDTYLKEIGELLGKNKGSLAENKVTATLARAKTLNIFRQLDPKRNVGIIRFLYEAEQLSGMHDTPYLDLSTAELRNLDFSYSAINKKKLFKLTLAGAILSTSTFVGVPMQYTNFSDAQLDNSNFSLAQVNNVDYTYSQLESATFVQAHFNSTNFSYARAIDCDFLQSRFDNVELSHSDLTNSSFISSQLNRSNILSIDCKNTSFSLAHLKNTDFSFSKLEAFTFTQATVDNVKFIQTQIQNTSFYRANIRHCNFSSSLMTNIDFSFASLSKVDFSLLEKLENVDFSYAQLSDISFDGIHHFNNVNFSHALLYNIKIRYIAISNVDFSYAKLVNCKLDSGIRKTCRFLFAELKYVTLFSTYIVESDFSSTIFVSTDFTNSAIESTIFKKLTGIGMPFDDSFWNKSILQESNMKHASFTRSRFYDVSFLDSNFYMANFNDSFLRNTHLLDVLSIQNAIVPNGTIGQDMNLIHNGHADCQFYLVDGWILLNGSVITIVSETNYSDCRFRLQSVDRGALMMQRVNLSSIWDTHAWPNSHAILTARMSVNVSIELRGIDESDQPVEKQILNFNDENLELTLSDKIQILEILVKFDASYPHDSTTSYWCDDIKLYIIYGTDLEYSRVIPSIPGNAVWTQNGVTVAGGHEDGDALNQLSTPWGISIDHDETVIVADTNNHRILQWRLGEKSGLVIAGGNENENELNRLSTPTDVLIDRATLSFIICDSGNERVIKWIRSHGIAGGQILIHNVTCWGLAMDDERYLYVSDHTKFEVKRYLTERESVGVLVAGGRGKGSGLDQFSSPSYIYVDRQQSVYVSDSANNRVMKWMKGATQGIVVAGGPSTQLKTPQGLFVDTEGTIYVAEFHNHQVSRWISGSKNRTILIGGNGAGFGSNQLSRPTGLSIDEQNNLYIVDSFNNRVQRFSLFRVP